MNKRNLFTIVFLLILTSWVLSPIAAFAEDSTPAAPTDTVTATTPAPTDAPTDTVTAPTDIVTDTPTETSTPDALGASRPPTEAVIVPTETIVVTETPTETPPPTIKVCHGTDVWNGSSCQGSTNLQDAIGLLTSVGGTIYLLQSGATNPVNTLGSTVDVDVSDLNGSPLNSGAYIHLIGGVNATTGDENGDYSYIQYGLAFNNLGEGNSLLLKNLYIDPLTASDGIAVTAPTEVPTEAPSVTIDHVFVDQSKAANGITVRGDIDTTIKNTKVKIQDPTHTAVRIDNQNTAADRKVDLSNVNIYTFSYGGSPSDGGSGNGSLFIQDAGDTTLSYVNVHNERPYDMAAAQITNITGMVKITNSTFHNIFGMGLFVASVEPSEEGGSAGILLDHVTSSNNGLSEPEGLGCGYSYDPAYGNGLFVIENMGSLTIKNSQFDCNYGMGPFGFGGSGITVEGQFGPVNISNTSASDNLGIGIAINGFGGVGAPRVGAFQPIRQTINLDHVLANENGLIGIAIGSSTYSSPRPNGSPVSYFSNINITNSQINDNGGFGGFSDFSPRIGSADISGPYGSGLVLEGPINAHVSNTSIQDNYSSGIYAWDADGSLVLCNVKFGGNDEDLSYDPAYLNVSYCHPGTAAELGGGGILIIPIDYSGDLTKSPSKPNTGLSNGITTMVFEVIETKDTGEKVLWGQATLPGGAAPTGSTGSITQKDQASLPGALASDNTYVGITFTLNFTDASGTSMDSLGEAMQVKIKLPDGYTVPAGKKLQIQVWDTSTSKWVGLDTTIVDGFAYANTAKLGTFTLTLIPAP